MKTTKRIFMTLFAVVSMVTGVCLFAPKTTEVQAASVKSEILEELMNVKMQLKKNANTSYDVRMVFGIDNLEDYQAVGFEVYYNNAKKPITVRSTSVRTNLEAISYGYQYKYSPKAMSTEAEYFAVATIKGVNASKTDKLFYVVPFVEMNDAKGTIKYGAGRCFSVNDGLTETYVNMTIPTDNALSAKDIIDVTLAGEKVSATVLKSVDDYAFVNVSLPNGVSKKTDLKAVSKVTYDGETTYYRNFHTATVASDEADTSWYDAYDAETTNKYVIATREELYGLAYLANHGNALRGKTIYLVSDITVNQASMDPADYATGAWATEETKFVKWVPIAGGDSSIVNVGFAGTFDGQDHTISGLYMKSDGAYLGLFATTAADGSSTIKNLKLTNSYFECTRTTGINGNELEGLGSIIGQGAGLIDTVYSDAIVVSGFKNVGGFVGNQRLNDTQLTIQNSWFDGKVTGTQWVGGLVGFSYAYVGSTNLMNCLVTADLTATATAQDTAYIGGIAGRISKGEISSCVAQGTITVPSTEHYPAGIVRTIVNAGSVTLKDIYNAMEWNGNLVTNHHYPNRNDSNVVQVNGESLNGQNAYLNTTLDFYEEQYNENGKWVAIKENELLQLKSFADKDKIDGLTDVARAKTITADISWYNDEDTEFTINTVEELYGFAQLSNTGNKFAGITIKLGKDIVVNKASMNPEDYATGEWTAAETNFVKWIPIAGGDTSNVNVGFAGIFDGQGHTISGLYMKSEGLYLGLFATLATDGSSTIKDLKLTNSYFECTRETANVNELDGLGSIAGQGAGLIDTVYSDAIVVSRCRNVGGFIGNQRQDNAPLTIQNCWFNGKVTGTQWVGGLIGFVATGVAYTNMADCLVTAELTSTATASDTAYIGGLSGRFSKGEIRSCVAQGTIVTPTTEGYPAGLVRTVVNGTDTTINNVYSAMKRNGNSLTDYWVSKGSITPVDLYKLSGEDLKGQNAYLNTKLDFYEEKWNEEGKWVAIKDNELLQLKSFADKDHIDGLSNVTRATDITADTSWYNTTDTEFTINTVEELYGFAQLSNTGNTFAGITIKLGKDIVVNKASMNPEDYATGEWVTAETNFVKWVPIAGGDSSTVNVGFAGTFDGQDHTISGLYMKSDGAYLGLFATTAADGSSTIKNLKLTNSYFECTRTTGINGNELEGLGSIIGQGAGLIDTVYSDAIVVSGFKNVGGFVGNQRLDNTQLTIQNSWFDGKVTGTQWVGGLVGFSYAYVGSTNLMNCLVTADLTATATAQDTAYIGGIAGRISKGEISSCVAQGTITVPSTEHYPAGIVRTIVNAGSVTLKDIYNAMEWKGTLVTNHHYPNRNDSNVVQISENKLQGLSGYSVYLNKLDFYDEIYNPDGKWVLIKNRLPELRSFTRTAFETKPVDGLSDFAAVKQDGTKTVTDYENYITELESTGYKLYASNKGSDLEPYVRTATYKKGEEVVTVSYVDKTSELYVSSGENVSLSKHLKPEAATTTAYTNGERTTMYMPELYEYGDSFIIQLKNGHFIVIDGGMTADALYLIKDLVELAGDKKPVIEAWFISHGDSDHAGPLMRFADFIDQSSYADKIIVEGIYYNVPYYDSDDSNSQAYLNQIKTILIGAAKCKTSSGATPKVYRPQIGQKYYFDDITVDVMYTHEQLGSSVWSTDANEASTWLRMTIDGKTFLHSGDALQHSISGFTGVYDSDFLDFDVVTTPHHAQHVTEDFLNSVIKENKTKVLYTTFITDTQTIRYSYNENELLREKVGEGNYICWGDGTVVVTFDGEQVEISHQNKRTWDWHPNRKTPTQFL